MTKPIPSRGRTRWGLIRVGIICSLLVIVLGLTIGTTVFYTTTMAETVVETMETVEAVETVETVEAVPSKLENKMLEM